MPKASPSTTVSGASPRSVLDLGRYIAALDAEHDRLRTAPQSSEPNADHVRDLLWRRLDALRTEVCTMPTMSLADAAVQIASIAYIAEDLATDEHPAARANRLAETLVRLAISVLPHSAPPVSSANRRDLFSTMGAMLLLTAAEAGPAKAADLDGELLALCAEYVVWTRADRAKRSEMTLDEQQASNTASVAAMLSGDDHQAYDKRLVQQIARLPARTPEGLRAKATALWWYYGGGDGWEPFGWRREDALIASVLDDVLGRAGA